MTLPTNGSHPCKTLCHVAQRCAVRFAVAVTAGALSLACARDGSIAAPSPQENVTIGYGFLDFHTPGYAFSTIMEAQLLIDGVSAGSMQYQIPTNDVTFYLSGMDLPRGHHTLALRIVRQTASPTQYVAEVGGDVPWIVAINYVTGVERQLSIPAKSGSLSTGQSIQLDLDLDF